MPTNIPEWLYWCVPVLMTLWIVNMILTWKIEKVKRKLLEGGVCPRCGRKFPEEG
jgi:hypothetical protein